MFTSLFSISYYFIDLKTSTAVPDGTGSSLQLLGCVLQLQSFTQLQLPRFQEPHFVCSENTPRVYKPAHKREPRLCFRSEKPDLTTEEWC